MKKTKKPIEPDQLNDHEIQQAYYEAMVEKECQEMGFQNYEEYEYYLKTRAE